MKISKIIARTDGVYQKIKNLARLHEVCKMPVIPLGLEPRAHTLKVYCSTN